MLGPPGPRVALVGRAHARAATRAWTLVRALYAYNLVVAVQLLRDWQVWTAEPALDPLWPVRWVETVGVARGAIACLLAFVSASVLAVWRPEQRALRLACALLSLPAFALPSSLGKINHGLHGLFWVLLVLVFLPGPPAPTPHAERLHRQRSLRVLWAAQAALLLFYSMSGALKLYASARQLALGEVSFLSPEGAARHIAHRLLQTHGDSLLGPLFIEHPFLGAPTQWLTLYLETGALFIAFRPAVQRLWAAGLIAMHLGIGVCMNIWFVNQIALLALLLGASPFVRDGATLRDALRALPGIDRLLRRP